jgi:hypothetical protein
LIGLRPANGLRGLKGFNGFGVIEGLAGVAGAAGVAEAAGAAGALTSGVLSLTVLGPTFFSTALTGSLAGAVTVFVTTGFSAAVNGVFTSESFFAKGGLTGVTVVSGLGGTTGLAIGGTTGELLFIEGVEIGEPEGAPIGRGFLIIGLIGGRLGFLLIGFGAPVLCMPGFAPGTSGLPQHGQNLITKSHSGHTSPSPSNCLNGEFDELAEDSHIPESFFFQLVSSKIIFDTPSMFLILDSMNFSSIAISSFVFSRPTNDNSPCRDTSPALTGNLSFDKSTRRLESSRLMAELIFRSFASLNLGLQFSKEITIRQYNRQLLQDSLSSKLILFKLF